MSERFLAVREVEEYFFCPMLFYYKNFLGMERPKGLWSDLGREIQEEISKFVRSKFKVVDSQVLLKSERLGVVGKVDFLVEVDGKVLPLEIKYSRRMRPWWRYTLVLYGMLLEDLIKRPVKSGFLLLKKRILRIDFRDEDRRYVTQAIEKCRRIMNGDVLRSFTSRSCENCDFRSMCLDIS